MAIDLCVVNHNTANQIRRLCKELANSATPDDVEFTLNIADNGSVDNSREFLIQLRQANLATVIFNKNIGYARACNQLAASTSNDIIALLNSDVWFRHQDLTAIQKTFDKHPEVAILGPKQRNEEGYITHAGIEGTETSCKPRAWKLYDPQDIEYRHQEEMVGVAGSAYFIRRSVWDKLTTCNTYREMYPEAEGAFLPTPHYYEETWCSYHARAHGHKVFYDGRISIGHSWHASHPVGSPQDRMFAQSKVLFQDMCDTHSIPHD